ncbi:MgtC/SapB family protein [Vulgatibacter sp.]|uniref:MgtC/SapB family protein n=1 Tax=Vulgatibacter sp. TaxID=1971226 RepID=UPI003568CBB8
MLLAIAVSFLLALPLGWERKTVSEAVVGLRVLPLVSVSACIFVILGRLVFAGEDSTSQGYVLHGLMAGIGFIGAGAIVKDDEEAHGLATAAAVWATGAIGASVAYGYYVLAVALCAVSLFILEGVPWILRAFGADRSAHARGKGR